MFELLNFLFKAVFRDYKIYMTFLSTLAIDLYVFLDSYSRMSIETYYIVNIVILLLITVFLTYRYRHFKTGFKEIYFTLPYHRETLYLAESLSAVSIVLTFNVISSLPLVILNPSLTAVFDNIVLPSIFLGIIIVNMSDDRLRNTFEWITLVFLIPFVVEILTYIIMYNIYLDIYWIFNLLPHEIFLSTLQIKMPLKFMRIGFNHALYIIYLGASLYIGIYIRERKDVI